MFPKRPKRVQRSTEAKIYDIYQSSSYPQGLLSCHCTIILLIIKVPVSQQKVHMTKFCSEVACRMAVQEKEVA